MCGDILHWGGGGGGNLSEAMLESLHFLFGFVRLDVIPAFPLCAVEGVNLELNCILALKRFVYFRPQFFIGHKITALLKSFPSNLTSV